jgi:hypothetical protein
MQHAVGLEGETVRTLLACASHFEGVRVDSAHLNKLVNDARILTPNERDGRSAAWRDYQQILPELGLIVSTKLSRQLTITNLGHQFLAGEIGFQDLISAQVLRYQYPNGYKFEVSPRVRAALAAARRRVPETLLELQVSNGILIKPGVLILRMLLELNRSNLRPDLTVDECQEFLLPCRTNRDWEVAYQSLLRGRDRGDSARPDDSASRRNIGDWFKFLAKSSLFTLVDASTITLSSHVLSDIDTFAGVCSFEETEQTFWIPRNFDESDRASWFEWFGEVPLSLQGLQMGSSEVHGAEPYELDDAAVLSDERPATQDGRVLLQPLSMDRLLRDPRFFPGATDEQVVESIRRGAEKRHAMTVLHDRLIKELAEVFYAQSAELTSDPSSIDLFAKWPDGSAAIFEVKTVTMRSLPYRLRTAIGQVEEYSYRRQLDGNAEADRVIVINAMVDERSWQRTFLTDHLRIGLICMPKAARRAFAPSTALAGQHWGAFT